MNDETYEALKDLVVQLEDIGLAKLNTMGEGNISTLVTMLKWWIDEVAKEYPEEKTTTARQLMADMGVTVTDM